MTPFRHRMIAGGRVPLHLAEAGDPARPKLLLVHGWPEFRGTWDRLADRLADDFHLLMPDLPGFGESPAPTPGPAEDVGPDALAGDLMVLLDALGVARIHVVTHDIGGFTLQRADGVHGETAPELTASRLRCEHRPRLPRAQPKDAASSAPQLTQCGQSRSLM